MVRVPGCDGSLESAFPLLYLPYDSRSEREVAMGRKVTNVTLTCKKDNEKSVLYRPVSPALSPGKMMEVLLAMSLQSS